MVPRDPGLRLLVDELDAGGSQPLQCRGTIGHPVTDVVDALASSLEEPRNRGAGGGGAEQLDERLGDFQQCLLDSVVIDPLAMGDPGAEHRLVPGHRRVEIAHGDGDVVDLGHRRGL